jgi:peptidoglycan/LPS O-acetylase OafA/YrhL
MLGGIAEGTSSKVAFAHVLRGIAALSVVISHCLSAFWTEPSLSLFVNLPPVRQTVPNPVIVQLINFIPFHVWGAVGVALFFMISGFVIPFTLQRRSRSAFLMARALRIWPTLIVGLLIASVAVACGSWIERRPLPWTVLDLLANISLLGNYLAMPRIDGVVWTLEIEIKFYVLMALFAGVVRRGQFAHILIIALAIASVAAAIEVIIAASPPISAPYFLMLQLACNDAHMIAFMFIGVLFNFYYHGFISARTAVATIVGLAVVNAALWMGAPHGGNKRVDFLLCYAGAAIAFALCFLARRRFSLHGVWARLGDISYPLYLGHATLGYTALNLFVRSGVSPTLAITITLAAIICMAAGVHRLVEVPSREYGRRLATRFDRWHNVTGYRWIGVR